MSWTRYYKRACAGGISKGMRGGIEAKCLAMGYGGLPENACMMPKKDGTWNGHINGSGSTMDPAETVSGLPAYECKWDATDLTGEVEFALGVLGNTQEPNANDVIIAKEGRSVIMSWDATAERYLGTNLEFTTHMNGILIEDEELCISIAYLPVLLVWYDFAELDLGSA